MPRRVAEFALTAYQALFFLYLFLPLIVISVAAFNEFAQPSVIPWKGFTWRWFEAFLGDDRLMRGLLHSLLLGAAVTALSLPLGMAGAIVIARGAGRAGPFLYTLLLTPILIPGVVLGISTLIFWREIGVAGGFVTAGAAQTSFIASYAMLMFLARLARQDRSLEEAALDLGASSSRVFRRIMLPYLRPTMVMVAVFENYNTTVFAIGGQFTMVTEIGSRLRFGLTPAINALAVVFILITILASAVYALGLRRGDRRRQTD